MNSTDFLRSQVISKLLTVRDEKFLLALGELLDNNPVADEVIKLTDDQIQVLKLSDIDNEYNRIMSQEQLDEEDLQWLEGTKLIFENQ
jgi:hypothetical protein